MKRPIKYRFFATLPFTIPYLSILSLNFHFPPTSGFRVSRFHSQEEEKRKREELERIVEENNKKIEEAQRKLAEERLAMVEQQRKMEEDRQRMQREHEKRMRDEQYLILGKKNARPKLSFSLSKQWRIYYLKKKKKIKIQKKTDIL